jgi:hypothetical protein
MNWRGRAAQSGISGKAMQKEKVWILRVRTLAWNSEHVRRRIVEENVGMLKAEANTTSITLFIDDISIDVNLKMRKHGISVSFTLQNASQRKCLQKHEHGRPLSAAANCSRSSTKGR